MPKLRSLPFETAIIERYRRRESSVEEALVEMYLAGVSVRRVEDITEALWGTRVSSGDGSRAEPEDLRARSRPGGTGRSTANTPTSTWTASAQAQLGRRGRNCVLVAIGVDATASGRSSVSAEGRRKTWRAGGASCGTSRNGA